MRQVLCLIRRNPARNMARFYRLEIAADLFGGVTLTRNWGRIGTSGQQRRQWFARIDEAVAECTLWADRKQRRGYARDV